jgi:hypothetical protein
MVKEKLGLDRLDQNGFRCCASSLANDSLIAMQGDP